METITHIAIKLGESVWRLPAPYRHSDAIKMVARFAAEMDSFAPLSQIVYGFRTSNGRFVSRNEAWHIASEAKQIKKHALSPGELTSEDLW